MTRMPISLLRPRFVILGALASAVSASLHASEPDWRQVHAEIHYVRTGTMTTAKDGSFTFEFTASIDQLMSRVAPKRGQPYPSYNIPYTHEPSFKSTGRVKLNAAASQYDEATKQTCTATASLASSLGRVSDLQLKEIKNAAPLGEGLSATFDVGPKLQGTVQSNYPRMPGIVEQDAVLLWPTPVFYLSEEGFVSRGTYFLRPVTGPRPKDPLMGPVYDVMVAANGLDSAPGLGGFRPPGVGCVTTTKGENWTISFETTRDFDTLMGGKYTDTISVTISPVAITLPIPRRRADSE